MRTWLRLDDPAKLMSDDPICWVHLGGPRWLCLAARGLKLYVSDTLTPQSFHDLKRWVEVTLPSGPNCSNSNQDQLKSK